MSDQSGKRLLISFAHPDDESFAMAGTIVRYVAEGVQVYLICATNGDVGEAPQGMLAQYGSVAELRLSELCCAAQTLGLTRVFTFNYRDSGMAGSPDNSHPASLAAADMDEVVGRIVGVIREVRPQVIVTFDPVGGYNHPDHVKMHQATERAFHAAGDPGSYSKQLRELPPYQAQKLYYHTFPRRLLRIAVKLMPLLGQDPSRLGRNHDIDLRTVAECDVPIHARIDTTAYHEVSDLAVACHASQHDGRIAGPLRLIRWLNRSLFGESDLFSRAYPPVTRRCKERDLFEGVYPD
jgi:LmbE family N-acetylglucosaminyl deacetylase